MTSLEDFVGYMKEEEEIATLVKQRQKDSRPNKIEEARKKLREYAYNKLKEAGQPDIDFSTETPDTLGEDKVRLGIEHGIEKAGRDSAKTLESSFNDVVNAIPQESLEKIAALKPVVENAEKDYAEYLGHYQEYRAIKELVEKYNAGKLNPKEKDFLTQIAAGKVRENIVKRMKDKGYDSDLAEKIGNLASLSARDGRINEEHIKESVGKVLEGAEKKFREYETKKGKKMVDYIRESLGKMATGNTDEFENARNIIYKTATGKFPEYRSAIKESEEE